MIAVRWPCPSITCLSTQLYVVDISPSWNQDQCGWIIPSCKVFSDQVSVRDGLVCQYNEAAYFDQNLSGFSMESRCTASWRCPLGVILKGLTLILGLMSSSWRPQISVPGRQFCEVGDDSSVCQTEIYTFHASVWVVASEVIWRSDNRMIFIWPRHRPYSTPHNPVKMVHVEGWNLGVVLVNKLYSCCWRDQTVVPLTQPQRKAI